MTLEPEVWLRADKLAAWTLGITVVGLLIALKTLRRGNLNASVSTASSLMAGIQTSLYEYIGSIPDDLEAEPSEDQKNQMTEKLEILMNQLEMASAIYIERSLVGLSGMLVRKYLEEVLNLIVKNEYVCAEIKNLLHDKATFRYIRWFMGIAPKGTITTPEDWYVRYEPSVIERLRVKIGWVR
jgi:hypothetical protein